MDRRAEEKFINVFFTLNKKEVRMFLNFYDIYEHRKSIPIYKEWLKMAINTHFGDYP